MDQTLPTDSYHEIWRTPKVANTLATAGLLQLVYESRKPFCIKGLVLMRIS
jgi:hypothetical protein